MAGEDGSSPTIRPSLKATLGQGREGVSGFPGDEGIAVLGRGLQRGLALLRADHAENSARILSYLIIGMLQMG